MIYRILKGVFCFGMIGVVGFTLWKGPLGDLVNGKARMLGLRKWAVVFSIVDFVLIGLLVIVGILAILGVIE